MGSSFWTGFLVGAFVVAVVVGGGADTTGVAIAGLVRGVFQALGWLITNLPPPLVALVAVVSGWLVGREVAERGRASYDGAEATKKAWNTRKDYR